MSDLSKYNLTLTREIDAPLQRVWQAWTEPEELQKWWGPKGVTNPTCEWEVRPGGKIHIVMLAGEELGELKGQEWPMTGQFIEIVSGNKLVYSSNAVMNGEPIMEQVCTVSFEDLGDKTKLTLFVEVTKITSKAEMALKGMEMGWNQSLDKLIEQVERVN